MGWIHRRRIVDRMNRFRAFLHGDALFAMNGRYLGRFKNGVFRDKSGGAVAFVRGASGGPVKPITEIPPIPSIPPIPPINPIPQIPPIPPIDSLSWGVSWERFLEN